MSDRPGSTVHYFRERLAWSAHLSDEPGWVEFYRRIWPEATAILRHDGKSATQLRGVDREIVFADPQRRYWIDEKKREKDHGDIALEVWDQVPPGAYDESARKVRPGQHKLGWAVDPDKLTQFIVYAIVPTGRAYLLPFEILRLTLARRLPDWKRGIDGATYPIAARNPYDRSLPCRYWTISVGVRWTVLADAMTETMRQQFGEGQSPLPEPVTGGTQVTFAWGPPEAAK